MKTAQVIMLVVTAALFCVVGVSATTYSLTSEITKTIDDSTAIIGKAFGIAPVQTIVTTVTLEVAPPGESGIYEVAIMSLSQMTYGADRDKSGYPNEENLTSIWSGGKLAFDVSQAPDGIFIKDGGLSTDSEFIDYNLLAFMLCPPGESELWDAPFALSVPRNCQRETTIEGTVTINADNSIAIEQILTQDSKTVKMNGTAKYSGTLEATMGEDGMPDLVTINIVGSQDKKIHIFGKDNPLVDNIVGVYTLTREGVSPE